LHNIWGEEIRKEVETMFEHYIERFSLKYLKAMDCLAKDKATTHCRS